MTENNQMVYSDKPLMIPRDYQDAAFPAVCDWFENKKGWPLVVIPTGGGKSLIMAELIRRAIEIEPATRFMILSHVSELLKQNGEAVMGQCPNVPVSFYSDKLKQKDLSGQVIIAGIQSIHKKAHLIHSPPPDLVLIDECHLIPHAGEGMYRKFLASLLIANPRMKVIGYTATPFRAKTGLLHKGEGAMFGGIAYEVGILDLIAQGYLCSINTPTMATRMETEGVKVAGGDFIAAQLEKAVDRHEITVACVDEMMQYGDGRKRWLIFTAGVTHCTHVMEEIRRRGIACEMLTGDTETGERNRIIAWHKEKTSDTRCLVNVSVLTTGYDNPAIDLIAFMRPTRSPVLYIQMTGRAMRIALGKIDAMCLDFGGVIETLGPIDQIRLPQRKKGGGDAPHKNCPECGEENHAAARLCIKCGYEFPAPQNKIGNSASEAAVLSTQLKVVAHKVTDVRYYLHKKDGARDSLRVEYYSGLTTVFKKWVCLEHSKGAREMACVWWRKNANTTPPNTIEDALKRLGELRVPKMVHVKRVGKYHEVMGEE